MELIFERRRPPLEATDASRALAKHAQGIYAEIGKTLAVLDVAADHAPDSPTYGKSVSVELSDVTQEMLFIPGRYAHAFYVLSDSAQLEYKLSDTYHPESVGGVRYDDAVLAITWPEEPLLISDQDRAWPSLQAM